MDLEMQQQIVGELAVKAVNGYEDWDLLGNIYARYNDDEFPTEVLLNYTGAAGRKGAWNEVEQVCRGLILRWRSSHEEEKWAPSVIAWPFEKFFNIGEFGMAPGGRIKLVTKKFDGSLGILYYSEIDGWKVATRGSFNSDHAVWATEFFTRWHHRAGYSVMPERATYLFEIIAPHLRNVIDYGARPRLVLLAARYNETGAYIPYYPDLYMIAQEGNLELSPVVEFDYLTDITTAADVLPGNQEGWVVEMSNGERWKVKGSAYVELHRIVHQISLKRAFMAFVNNNNEEVFDANLLPEEHLDRWNFYIDMFVDSFHTILGEARMLFAHSPSGDSRGTFAKWATSEERMPYSPLLFALLDDAPIERLEVVTHKIMKWLWTDGRYEWIEDAYTRRSND